MPPKLPRFDRGPQPDKATNLHRVRAGLRQQIERLTEAYLRGAVPLDEYERRRRDAKARLLALDV